MAVDKFGVKQFYPTVSGGLEWFADWDKARIVRGDEMDPNDQRLSYIYRNLYIGDGEAKIKEYGGSHRIFVKGPWTNTEMTVYVKIIGKANSVQLRSRSNHHGPQDLPYGCFQPSGPKGPKISSGFGNYEVAWLIPEKHVRCELEIMHDLYRRDLNVKRCSIPRDTYIGYKTITRTKDGNKVLLEAYNLEDTSDQDWRKSTEFLFDGTNAYVNPAKYQNNIDYCKDKGDKISGELNKYQVWLKPGYWNWLRFNQAENIYIKYFSIREIQPI
jgi:hypothetical protein